MLRTLLPELETDRRAVEVDVSRASSSPRKPLEEYYIVDEVPREHEALVQVCARPRRVHGDGDEGRRGRAALGLFEQGVPLGLALEPPLGVSTGSRP